MLKGCFLKKTVSFPTVTECLLWGFWLWALWIILTLHSINKTGLKWSEWLTSQLEYISCMSSLCVHVSSLSQEKVIGKWNTHCKYWALSFRNQDPWFVRLILQHQSCSQTGLKVLDNSDKGTYQQFNLCCKSVRGKLNCKYSNTEVAYPCITSLP